MGKSIMSKYSFLGGIALILSFVAFCLMLGGVIYSRYGCDVESRSSIRPSVGRIADSYITEFEMVTKECSGRGIGIGFDGFSDTNCVKKACHYLVVDDEIVLNRCEIIEEAP